MDTPIKITRRRMTLGFFLLCGVCSGPLQAGQDLIQVGYLHAWTYESSQALQTTLGSPSYGAVYGVPDTFVSPGTSASVNNLNTPELLYTHFFTEHIALEAGGGIPAELKISAQGVVAPPGPAGLALNVNLGNPAGNPLAKIRQWTPTLIGKYYYGPKTWIVHPYLGLGASYTWFTGADLNSTFVTEVNDSFGTALSKSSGNPGPTSTSARASSSWRPVYNAGVTYPFLRHWSLAVSTSYIPLHTQAEISTKAQDGTLLQTSRTQLILDPLALSFLLGYRF